MIRKEDTIIYIVLIVLVGVMIALAWVGQWLSFGFLVACIAIYAIIAVTNPEDGGGLIG